MQILSLSLHLITPQTWALIQQENQCKTRHDLQFVHRNQTYLLTSPLFAQSSLNAVNYTGFMLKQYGLYLEEGEIWQIILNNTLFINIKSTFPHDLVDFTLKENKVEFYLKQKIFSVITGFLIIQNTNYEDQCLPIVFTPIVEFRGFRFQEDLIFQRYSQGVLMSGEADLSSLSVIDTVKNVAFPIKQYLQTNNIFIIPYSENYVSDNGFKVQINSIIVDEILLSPEFQYNDNITAVDVNGIIFHIEQLEITPNDQIIFPMSIEQQTVFTVLPTIYKYGYFPNSFLPQQADIILEVFDGSSIASSNLVDSFSFENIPRDFIEANQARISINNNVINSQIQFVTLSQTDLTATSSISELPQFQQSFSNLTLFVYGTESVSLNIGVWVKQQGVLLFNKTINNLALSPWTELLEPFVQPNGESILTYFKTDHFQHFFYSQVSPVNQYFSYCTLSGCYNNGDLNEIMNEIPEVKMKQLDFFELLSFSNKLLIRFVGIITNDVNQQTNSTHIIINLNDAIKQSQELFDISFLVNQITNLNSKLIVICSGKNYCLALTLIQIEQIRPFIAPVANMFHYYVPLDYSLVNKFTNQVIQTQQTFFIDNFENNQLFTFQCDFETQLDQKQQFQYALLFVLICPENTSVQCFKTDFTDLHLKEAVYYLCSANYTSDEKSLQFPGCSKLKEGNNIITNKLSGDILGMKLSYNSLIIETKYSKINYMLYHVLGLFVLLILYLIVIALSIWRVCTKIRVWPEYISKQSILEINSASQ